MTKDKEILNYIIWHFRRKPKSIGDIVNVALNCASVYERETKKQLFECDKIFGDIYAQPGNNITKEMLEMEEQGILHKFDISDLLAEHQVFKVFAYHSLVEPTLEQCTATEIYYIDLVLYSKGRRKFEVPYEVL